MENFARLRKGRVLLTSRDGDGVANSIARIRVAPDGNTATLYVRARGALARRMASEPAVRMAPCGIFGRPGGSDIPADAAPAKGYRVAARDLPWSVLHALGLVRTWTLTPAPEPTAWLADRV